MARFAGFGGGKEVCACDGSGEAGDGGGVGEVVIGGRLGDADVQDDAAGEFGPADPPAGAGEIGPAEPFGGLAAEQHVEPSAERVCVDQHGAVAAAGRRGLGPV